MAKKGLTDWFEKENWVDISAPKKVGGYEKCGRKSTSDTKRGYPKCVPSDKASSMSDKQVASAVRRKRAKKQGVGGKPTNVTTYASDGGSIMKGAKQMMKGGKMYMKGGGMPGLPKETQGMAKGGAPKTAKGMAKGGAPKTAKGMAKGGAPKTAKGMAKGGAAKTSKGSARNFKAPNKRNSGLYG